MSIDHGPKRAGLPILFIALSILSISLVTSLRPASAAPSGTYFDHIVIVSMENTPYASVFGSGTLASCPTSSAPFLCSLLPVSSTIPSMNNYGATAADSSDFNGCSAACYVGLMLGYTYGVSDGYSFSTVSGNPQFVNGLSSAGLTWQAYCESGCPRGADHFPFSGANTFTGSSVSTSTFIAAANSASPPNFLWYTPTDSHNMHDVSVSTGDSYLKSFLVGTGSISTPAAGSLFASNLFTNPNFRTVLYLWWDECGGNNGSCDSNNDAPNLLYGTTVKRGYVSPDATGIDEYASLWTIESNWGFNPLAQGDAAAKNAGYKFTDVFGSAIPLPVSAFFTYLPTSPVAGSPISFTAVASGGTPPYGYSWSFGDGATGTGLTSSHTYSSSGSYAVTLTVTDSAGGSAQSTQTIQVIPVPALAANFTWSPVIPVSGQVVTFTATAAGGTSPYTYSWNLGGTTKTGNPVTKSFTNGTYAITLTVTDAAGKTATDTQSLVVVQASTGGPVPVLVGWGGVRMDESVAGSGGVGSAVFPGEYASDMELLLIELRARGYNAVRVDFDPYCTDTVDYNYMSVYSQTNAQRAVQIAQHYGFWIILDYHGYSDIFLNTSCWLSYWKPIVQNIGPLYSNIVWEPENEPTLTCNNSPSSCPTSTPCSSDTSCVAYLGSAYQQWIDQARSLGDTHWIVVQNLCSYSCGFTDFSQGYPTVTDPLGTLSQGGKIFISLHSYMDYSQYSGSWTNSTAESVANQYYQAVVAGVSNTGWPALNTEGGTDTLSCDPNMCGPDIVLNGSAGYTVVTFHFIQTLVNLYDSNSPQRINWFWWPAGSWTNTPAAGSYGAMQCNSVPIGWGCLLNFLPVSPPAPDFTISASTPSPVNAGQSGTTTVTISPLNGFAGTVFLTDTVPSGLTCLSINPASIVASGSVTVSCTASSAGSYQLTVRGASGSLIHSTTVTFNFQDFTVSASSPAAVAPGSSETSTITLSALNGFSGAISLSDTLPSGLTCGPLTPASVSGSGTTTLSCSSNTQNVYTLSLTANSGSLTHAATVTFAYGNPPDFTISATSPSPLSVGSSAKSSITVSILNGLTGTVVLTDAAPTGLNCGPISTTSFTTNGTTTVSCSSSSASTYSITITGTSGSLTHATTATFVFEDFSLTSNPSSLSINTGSQGSSIISLNLLNGFTSTVKLTVTTPSGITGSLGTSSITGLGSSTLTVSPTTVGSFNILVTGTSGSLTRTVTITVSVGTQASPVLSAPSSETVIQTKTLNFTVTATDSSIPAPSLTLSANGVPSDAGFTVAHGISPVSATFTWTPTTTDAPGTYTISFTADDGFSSSQTYVVITVVSANVLPLITVPGAQNAAVGANVHFTVSASDPTGQGGAVILSATGLASNMAFNPSTGTFSFTPSASQAGQTFVINFTATDSNDPTWTKTESVPIHVQGSTAQPSGGGFCLTCLIPRVMTTTAWLMAVGALIGVVSAIALLHVRATAELASARKRARALSSQNRFGRNQAYRTQQTTALQYRPRRRVAERD